MRLVIALVGAALALTACGGGSPTLGAASDNPSSSSDKSGPAVNSPAPETAASMTSADLRKQLLTINDLPPGYSADKLTASDSSDKGTHYFCNYKAVPAQTMALQTFTNQQGLATSVFQVGIRRYASDDQAADQMKRLKSTMQTCDGETTQGEKVKYSVISAPALGSDRIGIRIEFKEGTNAEYFILMGPDLVQVAMGGTALSGQTINDLTDLANKQVAKVQKTG
jgi:hypothetical protein